MFVCCFLLEWYYQYLFCRGCSYLFQIVYSIERYLWAIYNFNIVFRYTFLWSFCLVRFSSGILISFAQVREALLKKMRLFESQQENSKIQTKNSKRLSNVQENLKKVKVGFWFIKVPAFEVYIKTLIFFISNTHTLNHVNISEWQRERSKFNQKSYSAWLAFIYKRN